jgi:hypothetical protein
MREVKIGLLPHQKRFFRSEKPVTVLCGGRGCGKTEIACLTIAMAILNGERVLVTAQTYGILKKNIFSRTLAILYETFGVRPRALVHDMQIDCGKGTAFFWSADTKNPDSVRGLDKITRLVMDEAALASKEFYQICAATLRGAGDPKIYLLTTPRGSANWVSRLKGDPNVEWIHATTYDNTMLGDMYIELMRSTYSGKFAQQELLGEVLDGEDVDSLFDAVDLVSARMPGDAQTFGNVVLGIDVARFGDDSTVVAKRHGRFSSIVSKIGKTDTFRIVENVHRVASKDNTIVCVDGTGNQASGVVDILRKEGWDVREVMFNGKSPDPHFSNKRTYIYAKLRDAVRQGLKIPDIKELSEELQSIRFSMAGQGEFALAPKEKTKEELGRSPDMADALALTFATATPSDLWNSSMRNSSEASSELDSLFKSYGV